MRKCGMFITKKFIFIFLVCLPVTAWSANLQYALDVKINTYEPKITGTARLKADAEKKTPAAHAFLSYNKKDLYVLFVCLEPDLNSMKFTYTDPKKHKDKPVYSEECVELFLCPDQIFLILQCLR